MQSTSPEIPRLVIAGGGVAALEAVLALRELVGDGLSVELVAGTDDFVYTPMSVAAPFRRGGAAHYPLTEFARAHGADFRRETIAAIDCDQREVVTQAGERIPYDFLLIATGAGSIDAVEGAVTFRGARSGNDVQAVLSDLESGEARSVAFVVPTGITWALPVYELALLTLSHLSRCERQDATVQIVTAEDAPLAVFGAAASEVVGRVLEERGVIVHTGASCTEFTEGKLNLGGGESLAADRAIALPRLVGPALAGVPQDADGFIPVDRHCRVEGLSRVFAAGDVTDFPLKQGGLAAQQADAAVEALAADLGLHGEPQPFEPTLRGILLTGAEPHYLRARVGEDGELTSETAAEPLWWPPGKIAARLLAPHLAERGHGVAVSDRELVDQDPGGAADTVGSAEDIAAVAELAAALATVDVAWVTPTSLRPPRAG